VVKKRSLLSRFIRFLAGLFALILIALLVAGAVIALTDRAASVKVREWAGQSVDDVSQQLRDYLRENTR
jgi:hypothetical protein